MSPLKIEALRGVSLNIEGEGLKNNPPEKIDNTGRITSIKPGEVVILSKGQELFIPDVREKIKVKEQKLSFQIIKAPQLNKGPAEDVVDFRIIAWGYGVSRRKERGKGKPDIRRSIPYEAHQLINNPVIISIGGKRVLEVTWQGELSSSRL